MPVMNSNEAAILRDEDGIPPRKTAEVTVLALYRGSISDL